MTTTIDWPAWLEPSEFMPTLVRNALVSRSPFDQSPQIYSEPGEFWRFSLTLPPVRRGTQLAQARAAFFNQISAGGVRLRVPYFEHRIPHGTVRGVPTLSATASAGFAALSITGALAWPNLILNGGFTIDSNADGLCDGMVTYSAASPGTITASRPIISGRGAVQRVEASAFGSSTSHRVGLRLPDVAVSPASGKLSAGADVSKAGGVPANGYVEINWSDSGGGFISTSGSGPVALTGADFQRITVVGDIPANAVTAKVYIFMQPQSAVANVAVSIDIDSAQVESGGVPTAFSGSPTVLAGDLLGVGGQLFEVNADATLSGLGAGNVGVNNRPRVAIASTSVVTTVAPTATMVCLGIITPTYRPGWQNAVAIDLDEVWDA